MNDRRRRAEGPGVAVEELGVTTVTGDDNDEAVNGDDLGTGAAGVDDDVGTLRLRFA